jgi:hypothetical protein
LDHNYYYYYYYLRLLRLLILINTVTTTTTTTTATTTTITIITTTTTTTSSTIATNDTHRFNLQNLNKTHELRRLDAVKFSEACIPHRKFLKSKKSSILARPPPPSLPYLARKKGREGGDNPSHPEQNYAGAAVLSLIFLSLG